MPWRSPSGSVVVGTAQSNRTYSLEQDQQVYSGAPIAQVVRVIADFNPATESQAHAVALPITE